MKSSLKCLIGLQLPKNINLNETKDWLYKFNHNLIKNNVGKIFSASLHKKQSSDEKKSIIIISLNTHEEPNFDIILKQIPNLNSFKRYLIIDISNVFKFVSELNQLSYERFTHELDSNKLLYYPDNTKPTCLLKSMYHHYFCLEGDVIWYNNVPINLSKGKYFARQLYCELHLDAIKTADGYKVPADATINICTDEFLPQFQNKQIILPVEEIKCPNKPNDLLSNTFKITVN
jgi:hypothetical protein